MLILTGYIGVSYYGLSERARKSAENRTILLRCRPDARAWPACRRLE